MSEAVFDLKIEGLDELIDTFAKYENINRATVMANAMLKIGYEVQGRAREILDEKIYHMPEIGGYVRTGTLRASTLTDLKPKRKSDGIQISIKSKVHYAKYIEFGTSKMKARAFLLPAVQMSNDEIMEILKEAVTDYLKKEGG